MNKKLQHYDPSPSVIYHLLLGAYLVDQVKLKRIAPSELYEFWVLLRFVLRTDGLDVNSKVKCSNPCYSTFLYVVNQADLETLYLRLLLLNYDDKEPQRNKNIRKTGTFFGNEPEEIPMKYIIIIMHRWLPALKELHRRIINGGNSIVSLHTIEIPVLAKQTDHNYQVAMNELNRYEWFRELMISYKETHDHCVPVLSGAQIVKAISFSQIRGK